MHSVPLAKLENAIIKPGIEKHLHPLIRFRGAVSLGRIHRIWNFAQAMMLQGCKTHADGTQRLTLNPAFSHLAGPEKRVQLGSLRALASRLCASPEVQRIDPVLTEYVRDVFPHPFSLQPIPEITYDTKSWGVDDWRLFYSRGAEEFFTREEWAEFKRLRQERIEAEKDALAFRKLAREVRRHERAAELLARAVARAQRDAERAIAKQLEAARRAAAKEERRQPLNYPFLIHDGGTPEHALLKQVNAAVPQWLTPDMRADVCQDIIVGILSGDFDKDNLHLPVQEMLKRVQKMFPVKYGPLSLDALVPGTESLRLIDTISELDGDRH